MVEKLLKVRSQIKKRKPTYKRQQSNQFAKFKNDTKWRRPKGLGNKNRRNRRGHIGMVQVGFGSPKEVKGLNKAGFKEIIVKNIDGLKNIDVKKECVVIARTVGARKKIEILNEVKKLKLNVSNVKDIDTTIKSLTKTKKTEDKKESKKVESKYYEKK